LAPIQDSADPRRFAFVRERYRSFRPWCDRVQT